MSENPKRKQQPAPPTAPPSGPPPTPPGGETPKTNPSSLVKIGERGIMLRTFDDLMKFAALAVKSKAAPKDMDAGAAALAIQAGMERGLGPLGGLQQCTIINGNLSWRGTAAMALIQNSPLCKPGTLKAWVDGEGDDRKGVAVAWRVGYAEPSRSEFSVKDAKKAELWGKAGPWTKYPDRQLKWRAVGFLARDHFSDVLGGFPLAEEAVDFEEDRQPARATITASSTAPPTGPDPVLEAIEAAPVIDVEKSPPCDAPPGSYPVLDARIAREDASEASNEGEKLEEEKPEEVLRSTSSLRSKLGIAPVSSGSVVPASGPQEADPVETVVSARSQPGSTYEGMYPGKEAQNSDLSASEGGVNAESQESEKKDQEGPPGANEDPSAQLKAADPAEEAEPPDRASHLEADRALAKQEKLFEGKEES